MTRRFASSIPILPLLALSATACPGPRSACTVPAGAPAAVADPDPPSSAPLTDPPTTKRWTITFWSRMDVDPGNGHILRTVSGETIFTPDAVCFREESIPADGPPRGTITAQASAMPPRRSRAVGSMITRLLREYPHRGSRQPITLGPYSLGPPPDEGSFSEGITIDVEGEVWRVSFRFGAALPELPAWLAPLPGG